MSVAFFDIGGTLADVSVAVDGTVSLHPLPRVLEALNGLSDVRKAIISNPGTGDAAPTQVTAALGAVFGDYFTEQSLIHWGPKTDRAIFDEAIANAAGDADCVFVGEDPDERTLAREAGMRTAAHPVFTLAAVERRPVFWIRIQLPEGRSLVELEAVANAGEVVPVHVGSNRVILAMATARGVSSLEQGGFTADLRGPVEETSAYLIRDDRPVSAPPAFARASAEDIATVEASMRAAAAFAFISSEFAGLVAPVTSLGAASGGVYIAAVAGTPVEELHIPSTTHGHTERLLPDPTLLVRPGEAQADGFVSGFTSGTPSPETIDEVRAVLTPAAMRDHVARISGVAPLVDGESWTVRSRDASTEDNSLVVDALARRLHDLGLEVRRQHFSWRGHQLANVEAEYRIEGSDAAVLVTAHIDSTAALGEYVDAQGQSRRYDPALDPAPGADDDGSGVAAVLAAAECLSAIVATGRAPTRTLRFVLFNAEEQGLVGSKIYARAAAAVEDSIAAVLQMDMIAGLQGGARKVELHAGSAVPGPSVDASNALAEIVAQAVAAVAPDFEIQKIVGDTDPAAGRSDHASFHEHGWAAVAVSENFFVDAAPATGTRQYHRPDDMVDDKDFSTDYAAEIGRAVTTAAFTLAGL